MTADPEEGRQPDRPPERRGHRDPRPGARRDPRRGRRRPRGERDAGVHPQGDQTQRKLEIGSRAVLLFSLFPPAWIVGTAGLTIAKILENMEIGHNVMHGQWDWMRDPKIHSTTWEWDNVSPVGPVEALAQRAAPHVHERGRQGQRPRLRHHARRRGPALARRSTWRSRCGTSSTPASSSTASPRTTSSWARTCKRRKAKEPGLPGRAQAGAAARSASRSPRTTWCTRCCPARRSRPRSPRTSPPTWSATCGRTR